MKDQLIEKIKEKLRFIYEKNYNDDYIKSMTDLIEKWEIQMTSSYEKISHKNVYLIIYGDSIYEKDKPTLPTLHKFLKKEIKDTITDVHLLPMFPYTSDDGFSVTDYRQINPNLGNWNDITKMTKDYRLMFDFVANHISKSSDWFKGYLNNEAKYEKYFIPFDPLFDTKNVVRPRTSPLFHDYAAKNGVKTAWTTFSEDQVDVNVHFFPLLLEMTNILIEYAFKGGSSIRLDAIGFLWKISGTSCIHLPQTHQIIQMWRLILDYLKPNTQIITETNVPHLENISYLGDGTNEAHMVYQFSLPPLVLYTLTMQNADVISKWAKNINKISNSATFFNFLASHDGIGVRPTEGILTEVEKKLLVDKVLKNGGKVSYKTNTDKTQSVYEMNINYFDALINQEEDITEEMQIQKMLAAHAILLSVVGVPAIYYHSLLGSRNDYDGLESSGINRRINREKIEYNKIVNELKSNSQRKSIFTGIMNMINIRKNQPAFCPYAFQEVMDLGSDIFALRRENKEEKIYFILNVTCKKVKIVLDVSGIDLITNEDVSREIILKPYQFLWIK